MRRNFFTLSAAEHWNTLPSEVLGSQSLDTFKIHLDKFLCNLLQIALEIIQSRYGLDDLSRSLSLVILYKLLQFTKPSKFIFNMKSSKIIPSFNVIVSKALTYIFCDKSYLHLLLIFN